MARFHPKLCPLEVRMEIPGDTMTIICDDSNIPAHISIMYVNSKLYRGLGNFTSGSVIRVYSPRAVVEEALQWIYSDTMQALLPETEEDYYNSLEETFISEEARSVLRFLEVSKYANVPVRVNPQREPRVMGQQELEEDDDDVYIDDE